MRIKLTVDDIAYYSVVAAVSYTVATVTPNYIQMVAVDTPRLILFDRDGGGQNYETIPQTNLPAESVSVGDGDTGFAANLTKALDVLKEEPDDVATPTDSDPVFLIEPDFSDSVTVTDAQFIVTFDDVADFDPSTPAVDFDPVSITEADAKDVTVAELADNDDVSVTEAISNQPDIPKSDAVTLTEARVLNPQLAKSETLTATDAVDDFDVDKV